MPLTKFSSAISLLWWPRTVTATLRSPNTSSVVSTTNRNVLEGTLQKLMALIVISAISVPALAQASKESGWEFSIANGLVLFKREVKQTDREAAEKKSEINGGNIDTPSSPDYFMPAIESHLEAEVSGIVTRTKITQTFRNPHDEWLDGTYQFPLPEDAAVDGLLMRIGQREIVGEIREKHVAKAMFNKAKASGQKASLVNQVKANMFTTELANIAPFEEIEIEIQFQQKALYKNSEFQLRFPTTYTPRFGETAPELEDVISANVLTEGNFSFDIILDAGDNLNYVASPHFDVHIEPLGHFRKQISSSYPQAANRDLELLWQYEGEAPKLLHYREADVEGEYGLVMLLPGEPQHSASLVSEENHSEENPSEDHLSNGENETVPETGILREVTLVIDTSSSMGGASIQQAKAALTLAVSNMKPSDKFNLVEFNSHAQALWSQPLAANQENISEALNFLSNLQAQGGTNIYAALDLAMVTQRETQDLQQIVFITDGAIGYEEQLLREMANRIGNVRLFTVGIGSAPNSYFMVEAAKTGRGTFTHIASLEQVEGKMSHLLEQLAKPAITDLSLDFGMDVEMYPASLPDLYYEQPLVVSYRAPQAVHDIRVSGRVAGKDWGLYRQTEYLQDSNGISKLWANEKIRELMTQRRMSLSIGRRSSGTGNDVSDRFRNEIVNVALKHGLVSQFTSLIAIEKQISNPGLTTEKVKFGQLTPANRQALMHSMPQTSTSANQSFLFAALFLLALILVAFKSEFNRLARAINLSGGRYVS